MPSFSSSSSSTHLSDDAAAKSLAASIAEAERGALYISSILSSTDEEAIPPAPITSLPRRVTAIGPSMKMALSSFPMSSTQPFHAHYDKGEGKIPLMFDFFASEGKVPCDTTTPPTDETGVSTHLSLRHFAGAGYSPPAPRGVVIMPRNSPALPEDRWKIKKVLKKSDVDDSSRLLLAKVDVQAHILPHVMGDGRRLDEGEEVEVAVWDMDTGSEHVLVLKKWKTGSFVLKKKWMSEFVRRRGLENDEIGLRWDDVNSRLEFTVLNKN